MLGDKRHNSYMQLGVASEIAKYLSHLKANAKDRACLYCGRVFKLFRKNRYYCGPKCSRAAHYLKFKIAQIGD